MPLGCPQWRGADLEGDVLHVELTELFAAPQFDINDLKGGFRLTLSTLISFITASWVFFALLIPSMSVPFVDALFDRPPTTIRRGGQFVSVSSDGVPSTDLPPCETSAPMYADPIPLLALDRRRRGGEDLVDGGNSSGTSATMSPKTAPGQSLLLNDARTTIEQCVKRFTTPDGFTVAITTFNAATKKPPADLSFVLAGASGHVGATAVAGGDVYSTSRGAAVPSSASSPTTGKNLPDLIVVGLQEVDMSATALMIEQTDAAIPWVSRLADTIGADAISLSAGSKPYQTLMTRQLVGLLLCVYARRSTLLPFIRDQRVAVVSTGALGAIGNKGAVGFRCVIGDTSLCVINCHLAAHQEHYHKRNEDFVTIMGTMSFSGAPSFAASVASMSAQSPLESIAVSSPDAAVSSFASSSASSNSESPAPRDKHIAVTNPPANASASSPASFPRDHDVVIILGDLNYRVDKPYRDAVALCADREVDELLEDDQLRKEMRHPLTPWKGFVDLRPTFLPTYRFDLGTSVYDTSPKQRIPAFTDRVLYWAKHRGDERRLWGDASGKGQPSSPKPLGAAAAGEDSVDPDASALTATDWNQVATLPAVAYSPLQRFQETCLGKGVRDDVTCPLCGTGLQGKATLVRHILEGQHKGERRGEVFSTKPADRLVAYLRSFHVLPVVTVMDCQSHMEVMSSDHKPVVARLILQSFRMNGSGSASKPNVPPALAARLFTGAGDSSTNVSVVPKQCPITVTCHEGAPVVAARDGVAIDFGTVDYVRSVCGFAALPTERASTLSVADIAVAAAVRRTVRFTNTGDRLCRFRLTRKAVTAAPSSGSIAADVSDGLWLRVAPYTLTMPGGIELLPGEAIDAELYAAFDWLSMRAMSATMNGGESVHLGGLAPRLSTTLYVDVDALMPPQLTGGSSFTFARAPHTTVVCRCQVPPNRCFGLTIDQLLLRDANDLFRDVTKLNPAFDVTPATTNEAVSRYLKRPQVPRELWHAAELLLTLHRRTNGIFQVAPRNIATTAEILSSLSSISASSVSISKSLSLRDAVQRNNGIEISFCFLKLLADLPLPLVLPSWLPNILATAKSAAVTSVSAKATLELITPVSHFNVLVYVLALFRFLLRPENAHHNGLQSESLARLCALAFTPLGAYYRSSVVACKLEVTVSGTPVGTLNELPSNTGSASVGQDPALPVPLSDTMTQSMATRYVDPTLASTGNTAAGTTAGVGSWFLSDQRKDMDADIAACTKFFHVLLQGDV